MLVTSRQKQVQSTETLENTTLFIYPSKQTSCWHKPKIAVRKVSFTLRSLHFTFINVHVCYPSTPTFSSKSLICLLWISVLSSRSRILCKHRKKMEKSVFFFPIQRGRMSLRMHFAGITWWAWCSSSILSWRIWQSYSRLFLSICLLSFSTAVRSSSFCSSSRGSPYFITWRKVFSCNLSFVILFLHTFHRWSDKWWLF